MMADHDLARPYSEALFLSDDQDLLIGLYAADEDVRSTDGFDVAIATLALRVDVRGRITPALPGARAAVDLDEETTIDRPDDDDEEWAIELAIPLDAIGGLRAATPAQIARCDTPKDGVTRCAAWRGVLAP